MNKQDLDNFKHFYRDALAQVKGDVFYSKMIQNKMKHSLDVLRIGEKILHETPELKKITKTFKKKAEQALLFHDVGRFEEAVKRYESQKKKVYITAQSDKIEHGMLGYLWLKDSLLYHDFRVSIPILYHGRMMENIVTDKLWIELQSDKLFEDIKRILYVLRDADKLSNLRGIKFEGELKNDLFFQELDPKRLYGPLSIAVKKQFFAHKPIVFSSVHSFSDRILMMLAWIFDLNYAKSKEIFKHGQYKTFLLNELAIYCPSKKDLNKVAREITDFNE